MRTRDKSLKDYGVPKNETKEVYAACRDPSNLVALTEAVHNTVPPWLRDAVLCGLQNGIGYENVSYNIGEILCGRNDFYAFKRKAAAELYLALKSRKK